MNHVFFSITATFAIQISVEHNKKTGKNQVVCTSTISPESIQESGLKVYDDGRKSVYALHPKEDTVPNGVAGEMSRAEVEELLHQATNETVAAGVQYHQPVYSVPYTGNSRPSTPRAPTQTHLKQTTQVIQDLQEQKSPQKLHQHVTLAALEPDQKAKPHSFSTAGPFQNNIDPARRSNLYAKAKPEFTNIKAKTTHAEPDGPVPVTVRSELRPASMPPIHSGFNQSLPLSISDTTEADETHSDLNFHPDKEKSSCVNIINILPEEQEEEPVTMIFIGYENAQDEEGEDIQAELVILGDSEGEEDRDDQKCIGHLTCRDEYLSYHPEGCKSQIFQPKVGRTEVSGGGDADEDTYSHLRALELHKPTFTHKPGKHSCSTQRQRENEGGDQGCIIQEKLCSTRR